MVIRSNGDLFPGAGALLFLKEFHSDVSVLVKHRGSEIRYPVHSLFLISTSKVLRAMLQLDLQEKATRTIVIEDSNPIAVKQFLRFLYTGEMQISEWRDFVDLLALAHKYEVTMLVSLCEEQLVSCVSLANVCILHEVAHLYSLRSLLIECQKLITEGGFVVLKTESFRNLSEGSVRYFISHRGLNVEDEGFILDALRLWAEAECCRKSEGLTPQNVLEIMKPLLDCIILDNIPPERKSFLPDSVLHSPRDNVIGRINYYVPGSLQRHMTPVKFVVELGSFTARLSSSEPFLFVKFSLDDYAYLVGFRIVGMFRTNINFGITGPQLTLCREDNKSCFAHFNLNSIPWKCGSSSGDYMWKEMVAFFPQPAKIIVNCTYSLSLSSSNVLAARWPKTRVDCKVIKTVLGKMNFFCYGECTGVTELFLLPAPRDSEYHPIPS